MVEFVYHLAVVFFASFFFTLNFSCLLLGILHVFLVLYLIFSIVSTLSSVTFYYFYIFEAVLLFNPRLIAWIWIFKSTSGYHQCCIISHFTPDSSHCLLRASHFPNVISSQFDSISYPPPMITIMSFNSTWFTSPPQNAILFF